jgi:uncharacterized caspase-like protein/WD40 repeat protein
MSGRRAPHARAVSCALLAAALTSCTQPDTLTESTNPSHSTVAAAGKPPQAPLIRIETAMHTARISSLSADDSGHYLVTASDDKTLRLWELATGRLLRVLRPPIGQGNEGKMYAAAMSPDGSIVAGAGWSGLEWDGAHSIYIFDRTSGRMLKRITGLPQSIPHLAFSPDGRVLLATFHGKHGIRFYATADGRLLAEDRDYQAETYGASFDQSGRVVTASYDGVLRLYGRDFRLLEQARVPEGKRPFTVSLTLDGSKIAVGYENSQQVDVFSGKDLRHLFSPATDDATKGYFNVVSWSTDAETLYAGGQYHRGHMHPIRKWAKQGQGRWTDLPASSNTILRIVPLSTGGIAYGAADPALGVFDGHDTRRLFKGPDTLDYRDSHDTFLLSPDGTTVQFSYQKDQPSSSRFSLGERLLEQHPAPGSTLHPPRTTAKGLTVDNWKNSTAPTVNSRPVRLQPYEVSRCLAISPDHQTALFGTVWHLRLVDSHGRELWQVATPANVWNVNIAENGRVAAAALADGTIRWYRMADGQELLALFPQPDAKRWVVWTPSGYYDAGPGAETLLGWHKNYGADTAADFFPAAQFRSVSYRPRIVNAIMDTLDEHLAVLRDSSGEPPVPSIQPDRQPTTQQPLVIISPQDGASVSSKTVRIRYRVHATGDTGEGKVNVLVNGKSIADTRGVKVLPSAAAKISEVDIPIPEQDCDVSLVLTTQSGSRGAPVTVRLKWNPGFAVKPRLYALAVGVSEPEASIRLAANDANDFAGTLQRQAGGVYREVRAKVLTDGEATKDAILDGLDWLDRETTSNDVAVLFIKGQIIPDRNGTPYLLAAQATRDRLRLSALPVSDIKNLVSGLAGRSAVFMDVCQPTHPQDTEACAAAVTSLAHDLEHSERGTVLFSASTAPHPAEENPAWRNGAFTLALMEGLQGKAAYGGATHISVSMLELYVAERIKALTHARQIPLTAKSSDLPDFVLASAHGPSQAIAPVPASDEAPKKQLSQAQEILRRLPPVVTILSPDDGATVSSTRMTLRYSVRSPTEEPVTDIIGLLDGRPFPLPTARGAHPGSRTPETDDIRELLIDVPERESEISLLARNRWASSEPATIRVRWHRPGAVPSPSKPSLYALVIGVGGYEEASLKLDFSAKDAADFAATLTRQQGGLYQTVVTKVLADAEATKTNILEGLDWLERATTRHDLAVVFLAGHGVNDKNGLYYFLPVNAKVDQLRRTGLAFSDIKNTVASLSGKTLLFADTCHAGNIFGRRRGTVDINAVVNELTSAENGAVVFASSTGKQDSYEDPAWGNGAFTKALVEALNGKAAYGGSKKITTNMLDLYLSERVKELTKGQQTPTTTKPLTVQDFPIAITVEGQ